MTTATNNAVNKLQTSVHGLTINFERTFNAPRELVFQAWTESKHLRHWWGPNDWILPISEMDFRPSGSWRYCMKGPDGTESWGHTYYREISVPDRISLVDTFVDADDKQLQGMPTLITTVEFIDLGGKTKVKSIVETATEAETQQLLGFGMEQGMAESNDRLDAYLASLQEGSSANKTTLTTPSDREITMTRVMNAPRELVFKAHTDPKLFSQWWGLRNNTTIIDKMDVRPGGLWRVVQRDKEGNENAFRGEYRQIVYPERLVQTFEWEGLPGHIVIDDMRLDDLGGGRTRLTTTSTFASKEDRDGMLSSGMESGANESWDQLEELLAKQMA